MDVFKWLKYVLPNSWRMCWRRHWQLYSINGCRIKSQVSVDTRLPWGEECDTGCKSWTMGSRHLHGGKPKNMLNTIENRHLLISVLIVLCANVLTTSSAGLYVQHVPNQWYIWNAWDSMLSLRNSEPWNVPHVGYNQLLTTMGDKLSFQSGGLRDTWKQSTNYLRTPNDSVWYQTAHRMVLTVFKARTKNSTTTTTTTHQLCIELSDGTIRW